MYKDNLYIFGDFNCNFEKDTDRCQGKLRSVLAHLMCGIINIVIFEGLLGVTIMIFLRVG